MDALWSLDASEAPVTWSLDAVAPTEWMRECARLAGVTGDDAAVVAWHARVSRAVADVRAREGRR
jgi:hypothetical protein